MTVKKMLANAGNDLSKWFSRVLNYNDEVKWVFITVFCSFVHFLLAVVAVFAAGIYLLVKKKAYHLLVQRKNLLTVVFIGLTFVVALWYLSLPGLFGSVFMFFLITLLFSFRQNVTKRIFEDLLSLFLLYSVPAFLVAFVERLVGMQSDKLYRCYSTFSNPLYYAYFITFVVIICTYRIVTTKRDVVLNAILLIMNVVGMFYSGSRMPWIGMFAGVMITLVFCRRVKYVVIFAAVIAALLAIAALFPDAKLLASLRLEDIGAGYSGRLSYWKYALDGFLKRPIFGKGFYGVLNDTMRADDQWITRFFSSFDINVIFKTMKQNGWMLHAHNILLDSLYNFGVVGTILMAYCIFDRGLKMYIRLDCDSKNPLFALMLGVMASIAINGIVDCEITSPHTAAFSLLLFAVTELPKTQTVTREKSVLKTE